MLTITGEVRRVTFENEETGFRVLRVDVDGQAEPVAVVGVFQAVGNGTRVRAVGDYVTDNKHGRQFKADSLLVVDPDTISGIERYLASGLIPGVGAGFARRIVETLGVDTLKILDQEPDKLNQVSGLGPRRIEEIKRHWAGHRHLSQVVMVLKPHGGTVALAARILERYGERALAVVQTSPYRLALEVQGVGFKTADRIARGSGISGDHPERAQAGVMHVLGELVDQGHTYARRRELCQRAAEMLEIDEAHVDAAVDALWGSERVSVEEERVFPARLARAEQGIARLVQSLSTSPGQRLDNVAQTLARFERERAIQLSPEQRRAIELAAAHKVTVITGGPGVGKTTIVRALLQVFREGELEVALTAPTGRAAKRLAEATGHEARTIHRLLEYDPGTRRFQRQPEHPLTAQAIIVDEASMIDTLLAEALLGAVPSAARLVIVGDADQLPSVSAGAFLRDLIASGSVEVARLNQIFRQGTTSSIVHSAHRILHGKVPDSQGADEREADFFVVARTNPDEAQRTIVELVTHRIPKRFGFDGRDQVQVLVPMHRGPVGTVILNQTLQTALNPGKPAIEKRGSKLCVGDKVLQTKNNYDRDVYNGDVGIVESIDPAARQLKVKFEDRVVEYDDAAMDDLNLAYAISIHKSQGSEYPAVVIPLLTSHFVMLSRNLLYTAVTRARKLCVLVADPRALELAVAETRKEERLTWLSQRLKAAL